MFITDIESEVTGNYFPLHLETVEDKTVHIELVNAGLSGMYYPSAAGVVQDMKDFVAVYEVHLKDAVCRDNLELDGDAGWIFVEWSPCNEVLSVSWWSRSKGYIEERYNSEDYDYVVDSMVAEFTGKYL